MIKNPAHIKLLRLGATLYNFGGDSDSDSSTRTSSQTENTTNYQDKRAVASDQAVSLTGDGNTIDRSTSTVTNFADSSNRSTTTLTSFLDQSNRSTNFADSSDRSTHFTDSSDRSVTTNNTNTDYGSVSGALALGGSMTTKALDVADGGIKGAIDVLKLQTNNGLQAMTGAFDLAKSSAANSMQNSAQVLGFASSALKQTQDAYAEAKDGGQSKMMTYAIMAAAAIGIAFALKK